MVARTPHHESRNEVCEHRSPRYDIAPLFVNRWSLHSMTGESLAEDEFMALFAAKWTLSSDNNQSWRLLSATRRRDHWNGYLVLRSEANKSLANRAATVLSISSEYAIEAMGAIGGRDPPNGRSSEMQECEAPSERTPLNAIVIDGAFDGTDDGGDE